jgi:hypothetical protein
LRLQGGAAEFAGAIPVMVSWRACHANPAAAAVFDLRRLARNDSIAAGRLPAA